MMAKEWEHRGDYKYAHAVIDAIVSGKPVALGDKSTEGHYTATDEEREALRGFKPEDHTQKEFDEIFNGRLKWTQIFKGAYSGYENGAASGNKGNAFEDEFVAEFHEKYQEELEKALKMKPGELDDYEAMPRGQEKHYRPLLMKGRSITLSTLTDTVGESVVDVEVSVPREFRSKTDEKNILNLSLKYGSKVTFCNAGVSSLFPKQSFEAYDRNGGDYEPQKSGQIDGKALLDMFCIDANKFADTFIHYGSKPIEDFRVDVTRQLNDNKDEIFEFIRSVIGYNYVLVHKIGRQTHYVDLRTVSDMNHLIGRSIRKAEILYGGHVGKGKMVDIIVELDNMSIMFNFRDKRGGLYPTSLMADYKITKYPR